MANKTIKPGDDWGGCYDATEDMGAPAVAVAARPDWVRHPQTGVRVDVTGETRRPCPVCCGDDVRTLTLAGDMLVGNCTEHGFVWYQLR